MTITHAEAMSSLRRPFKPLLVLLIEQKSTIISTSVPQFSSPGEAGSLPLGGRRDSQHTSCNPPAPGRALPCPNPWPLCRTSQKHQCPSSGHVSPAAAAAAREILKETGGGTGDCHIRCINLRHGAALLGCHRCLCNIDTSRLFFLQSSSQVVSWGA